MLLIPSVIEKLRGKRFYLQIKTINNQHITIALFKTAVLCDLLILFYFWA